MIPLVLGFVLITLLMVGGSVAAGSAMLHQSALQDRCDAAALAVAAGALSPGRPGSPEASDDVGHAADFTQAHIDTVMAAYLVRDPSRRSLHVDAGVSADRHSVQVRCSQTLPVALGVMFGRSTITHHASSSVAAPTT